MNSSSNKNVDVNKLAQQIRTQIEKLFTEVIESKSDGTIQYAIEAKAIIGTITDKKDIANDQTLFEIKDKTDEDFTPISPGSLVPAHAINGKTISLNEQFVGDFASGKNSKTIAHEVGHVGGLRHPNMDYIRQFFGLFKKPLPDLLPASNFMRQGTVINPTGPTKDQMERVYRLYKQGKLEIITVRSK